MDPSNHQDLIRKMTDNHLYVDLNQSNLKRFPYPSMILADIKDLCSESKKTSPFFQSKFSFIVSVSWMYDAFVLSTENILHKQMLSYPDIESYEIRNYNGIICIYFSLTLDIVLLRPNYVLNVILAGKKGPSKSRISDSCMVTCKFNEESKEMYFEELNEQRTIRDWSEFVEAKLLQPFKIAVNHENTCVFSNLCLNIIKCSQN